MLRLSEGAPSWSLAANDNDGSRLRAFTDPTLVFPTTRHAPLTRPIATVDQSTDSGAHYIRTYHPDVDIPAEIIRDEVANDYKIAQSVHKFDPYDGQLLDVAVRRSGTRTRAYVVFPMGDSGKELKPLTILTSRRNGLITVYDVSRGDGGLVQSHSWPYALPPVVPTGTNLGHLVFRHPLDSNETPVALYGMDSRGGVHGMELGFAAEDDIGSLPPSRYDFEWTDDVRLLDDESMRMKPDYGPMAARAEEVVDFELAYRALLDMPEAESGVADTVYDMLDRMPSFWQESDIPVEQAVTTYDVAFRSGEDPSQAGRADFLSGSALNSVRGYRALTQGRIPIEDVAKNAGWHFSATRFLQQFVEDMDDDPLQMAQNLSRYDLERSEYRPGASIRREMEAREQLALDLALASSVFTAAPISRHTLRSRTSVEDLESMSRATEAMTLSADAPPVQFSFLRPIEKKVENPEVPSSDDHTHTSKGVCPAGVRLLLREWEPTSSTAKYSYQDPYGTLDQPAPLQQSRPAAQPVKAAAQSQPTRGKASQPKQPPTIVPAAARTGQQPAASVPTPIAPPLVVPSKHEPQRAPRRQAGTGPPPAFGTQVQSSQPSLSSQPGMVATQVLPGPFGGRVPVAKKKPAKKRMGGF
ncbi:hypothetical protein PUNSTDRAFT_144758 [Punctularia strigosozonata HHB-11173 SS5]|uniref:uncharacterized protein n=1 Tax=Punctularia strigosozonata (strain HHB-11173) TaxID=741275 RepID=UPI0004416639|nr:uncharacterized protein PUNSTDRAFT_144758 [Punctularia strigosozonata HHB-11173 SS5]EIN07235.1 hypothetical protein PUNSTDRAFT_144758 [Punctularia strigosozonata HHB-11173 SS5]